MTPHAFPGQVVFSISRPHASRENFGRLPSGVPCRNIFSRRSRKDRHESSWIQVRISRFVPWSRSYEWMAHVRKKAKEITVDSIQIEILAKGDSARYLGQKIKFEDQETAEIKNRLKAAWAAFHKYRQELTSKGHRLCHRLRLFNMVVTPTLTYASGTWTLTQKHEKMIKTATTCGVAVNESVALSPTPGSSALTLCLKVTCGIPFSTASINCKTCEQCYTVTGLVGEAALSRGVAKLWRSGLCCVSAETSQPVCCGSIS